MHMYVGFTLMWVYKPNVTESMQDHALKLTHLSFYTQQLSLTLRFPREFAVTTWGPLSSRYFTETFDYSRVKFVVHYFLGGSLSESNHSLLNSAGTATRIGDARVRARSVSVVVIMNVTQLSCFWPYVFTHWKNA